MDTPELIGYLASLLVAISLMMKAIVRLRIINMLGAIAFTVYGVLIGAWPVAFMNGFIVGINIFFLLRMQNTTESFKLIIALPSEPVFRYFLDFYSEDIRANGQPFTGEIPSNARVLLVMRDATAAGILIGIVQGARFEILLDYVSPAFRDFKVGRFLFEENAAYFKKLGCTTLRVPFATASHGAYLENTGFKKTGSDAWERPIF